MDFRSLISKLDTLNEAVTQKSIAAALVGKEKDEQGRAKILQQMAEKEGLPGLYDPISGYFVSAMPDTSNWPEQKPRISATASKADDAKLAPLGLIPGNANTSTFLGKAFGQSGDQYDADLRKASTQAVANQTSAEAQARIPKLIAKGNAILLKLVTAFKAEQEAKTAAPAAPATATAPAAGASAQKTPAAPVKKESAELLAKSLIESFGYLAEDDQETMDKIMKRLADLDPDETAQGHKELSQAYSEFMNMKNNPAPAAPAADAAKPADTTTPAGGASGQKKGWPAGTLGVGSVGPEVEALQGKLGIEKDGKYGPKTKEAVKALQKALGVDQDGIYGPVTKGAWEKNPNVKLDAGASAQAAPGATGDVATMAAKAYPNATGGEEFWHNGTRYQYLRTHGLANPGEWKPNFKAGDWGWAYNKWAAENKFTGTPQEAKTAYDKDTLTKKSAAAEPGGPGDMGQAAPNAPKAPGSVEPAPVNQKQRAEWARKYGATHNTDGSPKTDAQKGPTSESTELDRILKLTGL
jgi:peptidoglycan hydrolase-like protein with peptidoglycan-binding domain